MEPPDVCKGFTVLSFLGVFSLGREQLRTGGRCSRGGRGCVARRFGGLGINLEMIASFFLGNKYDCRPPPSLYVHGYLCICREKKQEMNVQSMEGMQGWYSPGPDPVRSLDSSTSIQ